MQTNLLSEQSEHFAAKLLKHYPLGTQNYANKHDHKYNHRQGPSYEPVHHSHDHRKEKELLDRPFHVKISAIEQYKVKGNEAFKNLKYHDAASFYQRAIVVSDYTFINEAQIQDESNLTARDQTEKRRQSFEKLMQQVHSNLGLTLFRLQLYREAVPSLRLAMGGPQLSLRKKGHFWLIKTNIEFADYAQAVKLFTEFQKVYQKDLQTDQIKEQLKLLRLLP